MTSSALKRICQFNFEDFVVLQDDREAAENWVLERVYHGEEV